MRTNQLSLLAILSIALATISAFNKGYETQNTTYRWYANTTGITSPTPTQLSNAGHFLSQADVNCIPNTQMTQQQLDSYKADHCFAPTTPICVAVIKYNESVPIDLLCISNRTFIE